MIISILMVLFAILLGTIGVYLYRHQQRPFLLFDPTNQPALQELLRIGGIALCLMAIIAFVVAWTHVIILICIILLLGCCTSTGILLGLTHFMP
ncbi:hypothetical protein [Pediococcus inopinatus]|uniref:hypothetical protein n=1 Tax=Pediococcus inopinatus TaxID=114090 RepID=UPI0007104169|nr:hypothetical protein [Pediococcus inopinatus]AVL00282.1 hypothetical protein PI20285_06365 [Pediococcus inopinatus]